jgi:hypothetical protein
LQGITPALQQEYHPEFEKKLQEVQKDLAKKNYPNFELWNKLNVPIYYSLGRWELGGRVEVDPRSLDFLELAPEKWTHANLDISKRTYVYLSIGSTKPQVQNPEHQGSAILCFVIDPRDKAGKFLPKTMYLRIKKEKKVYEFGPQTGPWKGFLGHTERGYPLKYNVEGGIKFELDEKDPCKIINISCVEGSIKGEEKEQGKWWSCKGDIKGDLCPLDWRVGFADGPKRLPGPCPKK